MTSKCIKSAPALITSITSWPNWAKSAERIEEDIIDKLKEKCNLDVTVELVLSPAWTTDWITEAGRKKLKDYGIAPPEEEVDKSILFAEQVTVACPNCNCKVTKMISQFGSTACKAHYKCEECLEPFDYFKCFK